MIACRNPVLAERRAKKRQALLEATTRELKAIRVLLARAKLQGSEKIAQRVKKVIGPYGLAEHFTLLIDEAHFEFRLLDPDLAVEALRSAFEKKLEQVRARISRGTLQGRVEIEARLKSIAKRHKLDAQVVFDIGEAGFHYRIPDRNKALKQALDGFCQALERVRVLVAQGKFGGPRYTGSTPYNGDFGRFALLYRVLPVK
ncbi:MAG: hypothetical protein U9P00_09625 [Pseudomonadota bacterium]|nr:hypothetical protein [Pseudomonadota bacterium]